MSEPLYPNPKMLVRIAQGDAFAMAAEYITVPRDLKTWQATLRFNRYVAHPRHHTVKPGHYTDDTQMSIAVAEALLADRPADLRRHFADHFVRTFQRDPREGYSRQFQTFLESVKDTDDFLKRIVGGSEKNGAAMRSVPIGVLRDVEDVLAVAEVQGAVTHGGQGVWAAQAVACMSHFVLYEDAPLRKMGSFCEAHLPGFKKMVGPTFGAPVEAPDLARKTVAAAYHAIVHSDGMLDAMKDILCWGGDTDTVGAIAWGIMSARYPDEKLPTFFDEDLENGPYGRDFLLKLGQRLMKV